MALITKSSRLDLIDNSQLTSFPLAHPLPGESLTFSPDYTIFTPQRNVSPITIQNIDDTPPSLDPLVLIEDYIEEPATRRSRKRISVLDFKQSLRHDSIGVTSKESKGSAASVSKESSSHHSFPPLYHKSSVYSKLSTYSASTGHLETEPYVHSVAEIEGNPLKYCVICEKALYEISNLIPIDKDYKELVCADCFHDYENLWSSLKRIAEEEEAAMGEAAMGEAAIGSPSSTLPPSSYSVYSGHGAGFNDTPTDHRYEGLIDLSNCQSESSVLYGGLIQRLRDIKDRDDRLRGLFLKHRRSILSLLEPNEDGFIVRLIRLFRDND